MNCNTSLFVMFHSKRRQHVKKGDISPSTTERTQHSELSDSSAQRFQTPNGEEPFYDRAVSVAINDLDETNDNLSDVSTRTTNETGHSYNSEHVIYENSEVNLTNDLQKTSKQVVNARLQSKSPMASELEESHTRIMAKTPDHSLPCLQAQSDAVDAGGLQATDIYSVVKKSHR